MLFDIVHVPKKRVHIWRHVKHLNQVSFSTTKACPERAAVYQINKICVFVTFA